MNRTAAEFLPFAARCLATLSLAAGASLAASPALAQEAGNTVPDEETVFSGDNVTLGVGLAFGASYDGSDDYQVYPLPAVRGRIGGIEFEPRGPGIAADFLPDRPDASVDFILGPVVRARLDRVDESEDAVVDRLGELDVAIEVGPTAGVQFNGLLNPYDSLTVQADVRWDVAGAHEGMVVAPQLTYATPLSEGAAVALSLGGEIVDDDYASYYFDVTPAGALASGLPVYDAGGGLKSLGASLLGTVDLSGDLRDGGWGLFGGLGYTRLMNDFEDAPIVSIRGSADQYFVFVGVGYTF